MTMVELFSSCFPDAVLPPSHAGRIFWWAMLELLHVGEVLPVSGIKPRTDHTLGTQIVRVLVVVKGDHQPSRGRWPTHPGIGISVPETLIEARLVDFVR